MDDQFQYAYQTLTGNGQIIARVKSQDDTGDWAKAGIVMKDGVNSGNNYVSLSTSPANGVRFQWDFENNTDGGSYSFPNAWLKLVRSGNTITGYKSSDGVTWTEVDSTSSADLPDTITVGLYDCSTDEDNLSTTTMDHVSITGAPTATYSIANFHGDTAITVDGSGLPTSSVFLYDPFGQVLSSSTFGTGPTDLSNAADNPMGWAASPTRKAESMFSIPIIEMGARVYLPTLGRFTSVDPVQGGNDNAYSYTNDPINESDYSGQLSFSIGGLVNGAVNAAKSAAKAVVGVVKAAASAVVNVSYAITTAVTPKPSLTTSNANRANANAVFTQLETRPVATSSPAPTPTASTTTSGVLVIGVTGSVGFGGFVTASAGIAIGFNGNAGVFFSLGGGGSSGLTTGLSGLVGINSGVGPAVVKGKSAFGGASARLGPGIGFDISNDEFDFEPGIGLDDTGGFLPVEGHAGATNTWFHQF